MHNDQYIRQVQIEAGNVADGICQLLADRNTPLEVGSLALITTLAAHFVEMGVPLDRARAVIDHSFTSHYNLLKHIKEINGDE